MTQTRRAMGAAGSIVALAIFCGADSARAHPLIAESLGPTSDVIFANGFESFTLTINNYLAWCSINEDGVAYSASKSFSEGTLVLLQGTPANPLVVWGYWTGTDAGGIDYSMNASVRMSSDRSVFACCPLAASPNTPCQ